MNPVEIKSTYLLYTMPSRRHLVVIPDLITIASIKNHLLLIWVLRFINRELNAKDCCLLRPTTVLFRNDPLFPLLHLEWVPVNDLPSHLWELAPFMIRLSRIHLFRKKESRKFWTAILKISQTFKDPLEWLEHRSSIWIHLISTFPKNLVTVRKAIVWGRKAPRLNRGLGAN